MMSNEWLTSEKETTTTKMYGPKSRLSFLDGLLLLFYKLINEDDWFFNFTVDNDYSGTERNVHSMLISRYYKRCHRLFEQYCIIDWTGMPNMDMMSVSNAECNKYMHIIIAGTHLLTAYWWELPYGEQCLYRLHFWFWMQICFSCLE